MPCVKWCGAARAVATPQGNPPLGSPDPATSRQELGIAGAETQGKFKETIFSHMPLRLSPLLGWFFSWRTGRVQGPVPEYRKDDWAGETCQRASNTGRGKVGKGRLGACVENLFKWATIKCLMGDDG